MSKKYVYSLVAFLAVLAMVGGTKAFAEDSSVGLNGNLSVGVGDDHGAILNASGKANANVNENEGPNEDRQGQGDQNENENDNGRAMMGWQQGRGEGHMARFGVIGTVSAVSGNTVTVKGQFGVGQNATTDTFSVDASKAKIFKDGDTSTVANIAVGDKVIVQGTVNGTNVVATAIRDGVGLRIGEGKNDFNLKPVISGNGQPVVAGKVTVISGNSITISNNSNVSYTIDATNAKIVAKGGAATVSNVKVGDTLVVQGTINGSAVTASSIIDQSLNVSLNGSANGQAEMPHRGFLGGLGSFFAHLFGF